MSFSERRTEAERVLRDLAQESRGAPLPSRIGRYVIEERLGEGTSGVVYRARDGNLGRAVAIKLHREMAGLGPIPRERFLREAQAAGGLAHPNVVAIHDVGEDQGRLYLVLELVDGRTLAEALRERPRSERELVLLFEKIARGVAAAHQKGIVHRDLKPGNVLVTAGGEPKVGDFGLAHWVESDALLTKTGAVLGTPLYMAPEQVEGRAKEVTPRTDVYALGAMLYEALTGRPPHVADSLPQIYDAISREDPASPRKVKPGISAELEAVVLRALDKDPARRYGTAGEFADDLGRLAAGEPVMARPAGTFTKVSRRIRRAPALYGLGAVATLAIIGVLGAAWVAAAKSRTLSEERERGLSALREQARLSLDAALRLRRAGATEGLRDFLPNLESSYRRALERAPDLAEVEYLMGRLYRALMEDELALGCQNRALGKDPVYAPALYERIVLRCKEFGVRLETTHTSIEALGPETGATKKVREPASAAPESSERAESDLRSLRDGILDDSRRLAEALGRYGPNAGGSPIEEGRVQAAQGIFAYHQGRFDEAESLLRAALAKDPGMEEAWEILGACSLGRAKPPLALTVQAREEILARAERVLSDGLSHDKGYYPHLIARAEARGDLATLLLLRGQDPLPSFAAAEADLSESIRLSAGAPPQVRAMAYAQRGIIRLGRANAISRRGGDPTRDLDAADLDLSEALGFDRENRQVWWRRSMARRLRGAYRKSCGGDPTGDLAAAEADVVQALALDSARPALWNERGAIRIDRGMFRKERLEDPRPDYEAAARDLDESLRLLPTYGASRRLRGLVRLLMAGDALDRGVDPRTLLAAAEEDLSQALQLEEHPQASDLLGRLATLRGISLVSRALDPNAEFGAAEKHFADALALNPSYAEAWKNRGRLEAEKARFWTAHGDSDRAAAELDRARKDFAEAIRLHPGLRKEADAILEKLKDIGPRKSP